MDEMTLLKPMAPMKPIGGEHQFWAVLQSSEIGEKLGFQSQHDRVDLDSLSIV